MKNYKQAPLPFQGQKRRFLKDLTQVIAKYDDQGTYVDLFGGSGLISHTIKTLKPNARVIYNDYDGYSNRLNHISTTNKILSEIRSLHIKCQRDKKLPIDIKNTILNIIKRYDDIGFVDYITLSSSLLFSANYVTNYQDLAKATFYNVIKQNDYNADHYLEGVECVNSDYSILFDHYKQDTNTIFLVDPPYLSTDSSSYSSDGYWKLKDYLDVLRVIDNHQYIYFTSNKSSIVEFCEWIATKVPNANPFEGAELKTVKVQMNYTSTYTDMMLYKYSTTT